MLYPSVDGGRYPAKRIAGEPIEIWCDLFRDGHDVIAAALLWRKDGESRWRREPLRHLENDRWHGLFIPSDPGRYSFVIEAWTDAFATWRHDFILKRDAGQNVEIEAQEGLQLLAQLEPAQKSVRELVLRATLACEQTGEAEALLAPELAAALSGCEPRADLTRSAPFPFVVDPPIARAGAWYEMIPRSQRHGARPARTFDDCIARLPEIAALGFDVVYLPPIHPIGRTNRKGRDNALTRRRRTIPAAPMRSARPRAGTTRSIPSSARSTISAASSPPARARGMEVALDFAIQCSPDHPWLKQHPEWFKLPPRRLDPIRREPAEEIPGHRQPRFLLRRSRGAMAALRDIVLFWVERGRAHLPRRQSAHQAVAVLGMADPRGAGREIPDMIFLSEAFTRPKVMKALAKLGFTQSYTYFTWRTTKAELPAISTELTRYPEREYFRPNFFTNTPDILPFHLQGGEPLDVQVARRAGGDAVGQLRHLQRLRTARARADPGQGRNISTRKNTKSSRATGTSPATSRTISAGSIGCGASNPALLQTAHCASSPVDDGEVIGFVKESVDRDQCGRGGDGA